MRKLDDETRRAIATGWDPHVQTMREYARSVGFSERAVRKYRARFGTGIRGAVPAERAVVPPQAALDALQARLDGLAVAVGGARAALADARAALTWCQPALMPEKVQPASGTESAGPMPNEVAKEPAPGLAEPHVPSTSPSDPAATPVAAPRRKRGSFFSDFE